MHGNLGLALLQLGRVREAVTTLRHALELEPTEYNALTLMPWILATAPDAQLRNPLQAMALAKTAAQHLGEGNATALNNLAAAEAACGNCAAAIRTARQAKEAAEAQNDTIVLNALRVVLPVYQAGQPFIDLRLQERPAAP